MTFQGLTRLETSLGIEEQKENERSNTDWFLSYFYNNSGEIKDKKVNIDRVSDYIIDCYNIKTIYGLREESIYVYDQGIWIPKGKGLIKSEIENILGSFAKNNIVQEIMEKVKRKTNEDRQDFEIIPKDKICLENGVLDISDINNIQLLNHKKEYNFKSKLPLKYDPDSDCPAIKDFLEQSILPDDQAQVQEWFGFHLEQFYRFKKAVVLKGPKDSGKSVFLNLLTAFVGGENISGLSLQKISTGKPFDLLSLKDKRANICDDLSAKELKEGGGFKMCVGDGYIDGEQKFGDHIRFRNTAKLTFACNKIPHIGDLNDDAYFDRLLVWRFDNFIPGLVIMN